MSTKPIIIETAHDLEASAAAQVWGRRSIFPLWMRVFGMVWGAIIGVALGAGVLALTQFALIDINPQMRSRQWALFPVFVFAAALFLWSRYQRFHLARVSKPHGSGDETYSFDAMGFAESSDGAQRRYAWWLVDDRRRRGDAIFMRISTVLHAVPQAGDEAQINAIMALWQAGRVR